MTSLRKFTKMGSRHRAETLKKHVFFSREKKSDEKFSREFRGGQNFREFPEKFSRVFPTSRKSLTSSHEMSEVLTRIGGNLPNFYVVYNPLQRAFYKFRVFSRNFREEIPGFPENP